MEQRKDQIRPRKQNKNRQLEPMEQLKKEKNKSVHNTNRMQSKEKKGTEEHELDQQSGETDSIGRRRKR